MAPPEEEGIMGLEILKKEDDHVVAAYNRLHQFDKDAPKRDITYPYDFVFVSKDSLSSLTRLDAIEYSGEYTFKLTVANNSKGHRLVKQLTKTFSVVGGSFTVVDVSGDSWEVYAKNAVCPVTYVSTNTSTVSAIDIYVALSSDAEATTLGGMKKNTVDTALATAMTDFDTFSYNQLADYETENPSGIAYETVNTNGWGAMLRAVMSPIQDFEDICTDMLDNRDLDSAEGINLDRIGQIVGAERRGDLDDKYHQVIRAKILENNSDGTAEDIQAAADIFTSADYTSFFELFPAKFQLTYIGVSASTDYTRLAESIASAKVGGVGYYVVQTTSRYFGFSNDPGSGPYYIQETGLEAGDRKSEDFRNPLSSGEVQGNTFQAQKSAIVNSINSIIQVGSPVVVDDLDNGGGVSTELVDSEFRIASTFIPDEDSWLDHIEQWMKRPSGPLNFWSATCTIHVDAVTQPGNVLATAYHDRPQIDINQSTTVYAPVGFQFDAGISLSAGTKYWCVIAITGQDGFTPFVAQNVVSSRVGSWSSNSGTSWNGTSAALRMNVHAVSKSTVSETFENLLLTNSLASNKVKVGQTFQPTKSGEISSFDFYLEKVGSPDADFLVELRETSGGYPTGALKASTTVNFSTVNWGGLTTYTFDSPGEVVAGTQYGVLLSAINIVTLDVSNYIRTKGTLSDVVPSGGVVWYDTSWGGGPWDNAFSLDIEGDVPTTIKASIYNVDGSFLPDYSSLVVESSVVDVTGFKEFTEVNFPMSSAVALSQGSVYACMIEQVVGDDVVASSTSNEYFDPGYVPWMATSTDKISNTKEVDYQMYMDIIYDVVRPITDYEVGGFATLLNDTQAGYYSTIIAKA